MVHFIAKFNETCSNFDVSFIERDTSFIADFGEVSVLPSAEVYSGSYEITPKVISQTVQTAEKFMKNDMTINPIPTYEVSNDAGGETFYIAKE